MPASASTVPELLDYLLNPSHPAIQMLQAHFYGQTNSGPAGPSNLSEDMCNE